MLINDATDFLESKSWYTERGIPFRRGYLLVRICTDPKYFLY
jgi:chaperone BCS1